MYLPEVIDDVNIPNFRRLLPVNGSLQLGPPCQTGWMLLQPCIGLCNTLAFSTTASRRGVLRLANPCNLLQVAKDSLSKKITTSLSDHHQDCATVLRRDRAIATSFVAPRRLSFSGQSYESALRVHQIATLKQITSPDSHHTTIHSTNSSSTKRPSWPKNLLLSASV